MSNFLEKENKPKKKSKSKSKKQFRKDLARYKKGISLNDLVDSYYENGIS